MAEAPDSSILTEYPGFTTVDTAFDTMDHTGYHRGTGRGSLKADTSSASMGQGLGTAHRFNLTDVMGVDNPRVFAAVGGDRDLRLGVSKSP